MVFICEHMGKHLDTQPNFIILQQMKDLTKQEFLDYRNKTTNHDYVSGKWMFNGKIDPNHELNKDYRAITGLWAEKSLQYTFRS